MKGQNAIALGGKQEKKGSMEQEREREARSFLVLNTLNHVRGTDYLKIYYGNLGREETRVKYSYIFSHIEFVVLHILNYFYKC